MKDSLVSVIVTTKNSDKTLKTCLQSIKKQSYLRVETIVVDNNSQDDTIQIAKQYTKSLYTVGPERSSQRNFGVKKSSGEYLLFLDSDMKLSSKVVGECVALFKKKDIKGIYIPEKISGKLLFSKIRNFERSFYNGTVIDAIRFVAKHDFNKINGFDEHLIAAEDWDLDKRIRKLGKTAIIKSPLFHDENDITFQKYIEKKKYYAKFLNRYIKKWGADDKDIRRQLGFLYRYFYVFIENGKWKKIIQNPLLFMEVIVLKIIVGIKYVFQHNTDIIQKNDKKNSG